MSPLRPGSRLRHRSANVGSAPGEVGIARQVIGVKGSGNRIVRHPERDGGNTEGDVCGGGAVVELGGVAESLKGEARIFWLAGYRCGPRLMLDGALFPLLFQ